MPVVMLNVVPDIRGTSYEPPCGTPCPTSWGGVGETKKREGGKEKEGGGDSNFYFSRPKPGTPTPGGGGRET